MIEELRLHPLLKTCDSLNVGVRAALIPDLLVYFLPLLPPRGPSAPSATMIATSWPNTLQSTRPARSWRLFRRWCPPSSAPSNRSQTGWTRAVTTPTARRTANQRTAQRRTTPAKNLGMKLRIPVKATGTITLIFHMYCHF